MDTGQLEQFYGNRVRIRVSGIAVKEGRLLLVGQEGLRSSGLFWSPPGGGVEFGEKIPEALVREFREETGLEIEVGNLLFVNEFRSGVLHAIELFFDVSILSGELCVGADPEMDDQIIRKVQFMHMTEILTLPENARHNLFCNCTSLEDLYQIRGYISN